MARINLKDILIPGILVSSATQPSAAQSQQKPNIIFIYADDLGYGDVSCYGAKSISTPNIDRAARQGLRFTNAHCTSATSTPSRYSLLTGQYAFRKKGTGVLPGDASMIIAPGTTTLASLLKSAGYTTGVVGKWHLGLGPSGGPDWNGEIKPGPMDIGFDYNFIIPATGDRVPCVYVEDRRVAGLNPSDPISVSYSRKTGDWPTGKENPELLTMRPSEGHNNTIVNGISRIGYMSGGRSALWQDDRIAETITARAVSFIEKNISNSFFLYFATHDIHVPRVPGKAFAGKSGMGPRGDAILEFDWSVGEILNTLERLKLDKKTLVIITSDNGPVVDDGYQDQAVELLGSHRPAGPLRGGKYSAFDGGTRVIFIAEWPGKIKAGESSALSCQVDMMASLAHIAGVKVPSDAGPDSFDFSDVLLGRSKEGRKWIVEHATNGRLSVIKGDWKYIEPGPGPKKDMSTNIELGNDTVPQLYNLKTDIGEKNNLFSSNPSVLSDLMELLAGIRKGSVTAK